MMKDTRYKIQDTARRGATLAELILVIGIVAILTGATTLMLVGRRSGVAIEGTRDQIVGVLREAHSRSTAQAEDDAWGVRFENAAGDRPFFALFHGTYDTASVIRRETLPENVKYSTSSVPEGRHIEVNFDQLSGTRTGSSSVGIYVTRPPHTSFTINVATSGLVSY